MAILSDRDDCDRLDTALLPTKSIYWFEADREWDF
jgi:hypothetical protein